MARPVSVELVDVEATDGFRFVCGLAVPATTRPAAGGSVDAILFHPGSTGTFYQHWYRPWLSGIPERGYPVMIMNNRGSHIVLQDSITRAESLLGDLEDRDPARQAVRAGLHGHALENIDDSRHDIRAALDELERRGYSRIALLGHSLGGVKATLYVVREGDPRVVALIAASHPELSAAKLADNDGSGAYARTIDKARRVASGGGELDLMLSEFPFTTLVGAAAYLKKYGAENYNTLPMAPHISIPLMGLVGENEVAVATPHFTGDFVAAAVSSPQRETYVVPGANHFYSGCEDDAMDHIVAFIAQL